MAVRSQWGGYVAALLATGAAVGLRWGTDSWLGHEFPFITLYGAVAIAVCYGGLGPALLSVALGYLASRYLFVEPRGTLAISEMRHLLGLVFYLLSCSLIVILATWRVHRETGRREHDLRRRIEELARADRRKEAFLATLGHELRHPLGSISNVVAFLHLKIPSDPELEKAREILDRQVRHMTRLVDDLLEISRISQGKMQLRKERVELAGVLRNAVDVARPLLDEAKHQLTIAQPAEPIFLEADPTRLTQVLVNLLSNAIRYTEKGGHIRLTVDRQGNEAVISIRDTGIGIAGEHLPHIFDMFSQAASIRPPSAGGLGIGLSLVRGLVELHGGRVEARSDGLGQGSEFIVRLPAASS